MRISASNSPSSIPPRGPRRTPSARALAEAQARIRTTLFALRQEVDDAFFAAALLQERETQVTLAITDLEARLREARLRVERGNGVAQRGRVIEATLLQRRRGDQLRAGRRAALARLAELTGRSLTQDDRLVLPDAGAR